MPALITVTGSAIAYVKATGRSNELRISPRYIGKNNPIPNFATIIYIGIKRISKRRIYLSILLNTFLIF